MKSKYSSQRAQWGEIFGLTSNDLTTQQLEKITIGKLLEFTSSDSRIEKIIGDKVVSANTKWEDLSALSNLDDDDVKKVPYITQKYNEFIATHACPNESCYGRDRYIIWKFLNKENKVKECKDWLNDQRASFSPNKDDFDWLFAEYLDVAKSIANKIMSSSSRYYGHYYYSDKEQHYKNMLPSFPEDFLKEKIDFISKQVKPFPLYLLSNKFTPLDYAEKLLRSIAGKTHIPSMFIKLGNDLLTRIPPVMRLNLVESLLYNMRDGYVEFVDVKDESDLNALFFGTAIKYNTRVQKVVDSFKKKLETIKNKC